MPRFSAATAPCVPTKYIFMHKLKCATIVSSETTVYPLFARPLARAQMIASRRCRPKRLPYFSLFTHRCLFLHHYFCIFHFSQTRFKKKTERPKCAAFRYVFHCFVAEGWYLLVGMYVNVSDFINLQ